MQKPPTPSNEAARILSIRKLHLLDTPYEEQFDRITRIAKRLFNVEICLISIVDTDRQYFKSNQGLEGVWETSREVSFCAHTILSDEISVVEDAQQDDRFCDNPLVKDTPEIRFYAGVPIYSPDNYAIGTLCIIDSKPRKLSDEDRESLSDLAGMVEDQLRLSADATTDNLTKLVNRRGFESISKQILSGASKTQRDVQLLFFDLDHLKEINDGFGHSAGDVLLCEFAHILKLCFKASDLLARIGGDEFVVLSLGSKDEANATLVRLKDAAAESKVSKLDWSVGLASFNPSRNQTIEDLMVEADAQMYKDKLLGK